MSSTPDWTACQNTLQSLLELIKNTQTAAQQTLQTGQPEPYTASCSELAKALASSQPELAQALQQGTPPPTVLNLLQQVKTGLNALQEHTTRAQAHAERALGVLFPTDQVQAYSRLGSKAYGVQGSKPGSNYLKA